MRRPELALSAGLAALAVAVIAVGFVRAIKLGPGTTPDSAANQHATHQDRAARPATTKAPAKAAEHGGAHKSEGPTPPSAIDNGRYALQLDRQVVRVGTRRLGFTITDVRTGKPVTRYDTDLTKKLHLIIIREDLSGFQHVHPTLAADGHWTVNDAVLRRAGAWRMIADFVPTGATRTVLASTVQASPGSYRARPIRESPRTGRLGWHTTVAGYDVTLRTTKFVGGRKGRMTYQIHRHGRSVADLQPYLGALGHTVVLRAGDIGYTHVHPLTSGGAAGRVQFDVDWPRAAPLAVFFQFRHRDTVRTARFNLPAPPTHG